MARILLVDDDEPVRQMLAEMLEDMGHSVAQAADGGTCLERVEERDFDLLITDIVMPEQGGLRAIDGVRQVAPTIKILAISGGGSLLGSQDYLELAQSLGADATLRKPFRRAELTEVIAGLVAS